MSDRSFLRFGGLAGVLLAITSWTAVVAYYGLVPAAQRAPLSGTRDVAGYLASLPGNTMGLVIFNGLYALIAFWALIATIAAYLALRRNGEAWAFFATLVGTFASAATIVASVGEVARVRYLAENAGTAAQLAEPNAANPLGIVSFGLTSVWFIVAAALMLRGGFPRLLALVGFVAFADLIVGFVASLAGASAFATLTAVVAGAVGGPIFWLWLGILLWRDAGRLPS
jgi:hypothetical protein